MGLLTQRGGEKSVSWGVFVVLFFIGVIACLVTQLIVKMEHGPKVYASLLGGVLNPVGLFLTDEFRRMGYALHVPMTPTMATDLGLVVASGIFGLIVVGLVGLARSSNRAGRYIGIVAVGILAVLALFWGALPNVF